MFSLISKIKTWLAIAGGVIVGALFFYMKGKGEGKQEAVDEHLQDVVDLNEKFDEIDSSDANFDDALKRMRNRTKP